MVLVLHCKRLSCYTKPKSRKTKPKSAHRFAPCQVAHHSQECDRRCRRQSPQSRHACRVAVVVKPEPSVLSPWCRCRGCLRRGGSGGAQAVGARSAGAIAVALVVVGNQAAFLPLAPVSLSCWKQAAAARSRVARHRRIDSDRRVVVVVEPVLPPLV